MILQNIYKKAIQRKRKFWRFLRSLLCSFGISPGSFCLAVPSTLSCTESYYVLQRITKLTHLGYRVQVLQLS